MALWETKNGMPPGLMLPLHPGDWRIHSIATLRYGASKGDFTPEYVSHDVEIKITVFGQFWEHINEVLVGEPPGPIGSRKLPPVGGTRQRAADIEAG